jgi:Linalool dehydratase/isomerase
MVETARQLQDDWTHLQPMAPVSFDAYQFQLAFMSYALATVQVQWTPAYRELFRDTQRRLIEKFLLPASWQQVWLPTLADPHFNRYLDLSRDWRDPVREKNIMYSGHLLQMIGLYETLYADRRFSRPGAMVFEMHGQDGFRHVYDTSMIAELIHRQFVESDFIGIECEPNDIYAECNQHPILGLIHFDRLNGTRFADVRDKFWQRATELGYIVPATQRTMFHYRIKEREVFDRPFAWSDGWNAIFMNGWAPDLVAQLYPVHRDAELADLLDARPEHWLKRWADPFVSFDFGFLAAYAAELGDRQTVQALLDYADEHFHPTWRDGRYYYPRRDVATTDILDYFFLESPPVLPPAQLGHHHVGTLSGNAVLLFARLNRGGGIRQLYSDEFALSFASSADPEIVDVRYPEVLVSSARYDRNARVLTARFVAGTDYRGKSGIGVRGLDPSGRFAVLLNGKPLGRLQDGVVRATSRGSLRWDMATQRLHMEIDLVHPAVLEVRRLDSPVRGEAVAGASITMVTEPEKAR